MAMKKYDTNSLSFTPATVTIDGVTYSASTVKGLFRIYAKTQLEDGVRLMPGWQEEVWIELKKNYPRSIVVKEIVPPGPRVGIAAASAFIQFIHKRWTDRTLVTQAEAERRAAICQKCPLSVPISGCGVCKTALQLFVKPPVAVATPQGCAACGCWMPLKIWVPRNVLGDAASFPFDDDCWMREPQEECVEQP